MKNSIKPTPLHFNHNGRPISVFADGGESLLSLLRLRLVIKRRSTAVVKEDAELVVSK